MQHENGEQLDLLDRHAKNFFIRCTPSMMKCVVGINHYGERIKCIDKINETAACPLCGEIEDWNHFYCMKIIGIKEKNG